MTVILVILAIIFSLLLFILLIRFGVLITFDEKVTYQLRIAFIYKTIELNNKHFKNKDKNQNKNTNTELPNKKERKKPKITLDLIKSAVPELWKSLDSGIKKTKKRIRVSPCTLAVILGGKNSPADAAKWYGWLTAFMFTYLPRLERSCNIPDPGIHLDVDYQIDKIKVYGKLGISFCLLDILKILFSFLKPLLMWYKKHKEELFPEENVSR